jgi:N4-gp56 family major capsid protein
MKLYNLNLQLFALNAADSTAEGANNLTHEMKTFYDKALLREADANLVHDQFGQKRPIPKNGGKKIEFRKFASLPKALTPLVEGVTPDGSNLSVSIVEAEVAQYGAYVTQTDVLELTAIDNTIVEATQVLGNQAGLTLDAIVRDIINTGTNVYYAPSVAADGTTTVIDSRAKIDNTCKLTPALVKEIVAFLKGNNAPKIDGYYVAIIHPYVAFDLMSSEEWMEVQKYATPENMLKGELGKLGGVRFVESTEAKVWEAGKDTCAVFSTLFLGANAYGVTEVEGGGLETIIKQKGSAGTADPLNQRSSIGWKAMRTAEILFDPYMVRCESGSSFSKKARAN